MKQLFRPAINKDYNVKAGNEANIETSPAEESNAISFDDRAKLSLMT